MLPQHARIYTLPDYTLATSHAKRYIVQGLRNETHTVKKKRLNRIVFVLSCDEASVSPESLTMPSRTPFFALWTHALLPCLSPCFLPIGSFSLMLAQAPIQHWQVVYVFRGAASSHVCAYSNSQAQSLHTHIPKSLQTSCVISWSQDCTVADDFSTHPSRIYS